MLLVGILALTSLLAFAQDGSVSKVEKTSYGAKVTLRFDRDYAGGDLITIVNVAHWNQSVSCTEQNGELIANVSYDRKLLFNNCKPGEQCQLPTQISASRTFKVRTAELCETGIPLKVFVNGNQI